MDPLELRRRLQRLAQWEGPVRGYHGRHRNEALYAAHVALAIDLQAVEREWYARRAYLARYMRQPLSELDSLPVQEARRYMRALAEIVRAESPLAPERE